MSLFDFFRRPPPPHKYARLLIRKLALHAPDQPVHYDEAGFRLLLGDRDNVINLHNLYHEYCAADRHERARQLDRCAALVLPAGIPASFTEARAHLMPALRGRSMAEYLRLMAPGSESDTLSHSLFFPFSSDATLMIVHDGESTMQSIGPAQLQQWGVSAEEALVAAMDNLRDATADRFVQVGRGVFAGDWGDAYDSSRLLLPDLAHRIAGANPLAMIPARGTLLLASGNDIEGVRAMVALAQRIADTETRPVSALMYRYEENRPVEHLPDDEVARSALVHLGRQYLYGDYAAQKETLDELHEKNGADIFVASYKVMRDDASGLEYSLCSWTSGADSLLPRTDRVALVVHDGKHMQELHVLPWDTLYAACAHLMEPVLEAYPARYRVRAFPDLELVRPLALPAQV